MRCAFYVSFSCASLFSSANFDSVSSDICHVLRKRGGVSLCEGRSPSCPTWASRVAAWGLSFVYCRRERISVSEGGFAHEETYAKALGKKADGWHGRLVFTKPSGDRKSVV